ncbi:anti-sigma factor [Phenylobacterium aquaticum]|uniref:anti-sigma factor n=1 Tax=Phenylobacterium aquaticum TaxID=1763816 RepID=UPI001F5D14D0|nr:anti-sigma factor [Phenylobacterium aquaticum]MCI3132297.1 anti-sigma factor [Phenylobacterium aquaticum]
MSEPLDELPADEALAAEHALGVLSAPERAQAELRMAREPAFAAHVEAWAARLAPMLDALPAVTAPEGLWPRIERALPANDNGSAATRLWRGLAMGSMALAAASVAALVVLANRPPTVIAPQAPPSAGELLNARLDTSGGQHLFVAAYDPVRQKLIVTSLVTPGSDPVHVHELWLIPADGKPHSLGLIAPGTSKSMPMPEGLEKLAQEGASIAVSVEKPDAPKHDRPMGPVAAIGKLAKI